MDVDPDTGRVIISWSNFTPLAPGGVEISIAYSDNALTGNPPAWSTRRVVAKAPQDGQSTVPRFVGGGSQSVYLAWERFPFPGTLHGYGQQIGFSVSNDNGATWSAPADITPEFLTMDEVLGNDRVNSAPSMAVDNSPGPHHGNVYVVYSNNTSRDGADVVLLRSINNGATFLEPVILNSRPAADRAQWFPYLAVDNTTGRVYVTYYDQGIATSGDLTEVTVVYSDDGGVTWSRPLPLTSRPFHAGYGNDATQPNLGDYNQAVAQSGEFFAVWAGAPPLVNFFDGQPSTTMTVPDVYVNESLIFKHISASHSQAAVRLGHPTFTDSGSDVAIRPWRLKTWLCDASSPPIKEDADDPVWMSGIAYFGSAYQEFGRAGEAHWSSFSRIRWCAGSATGFGVSGLGCPKWTVAVLEGRPWLQKCDGSSCRLPGPIRCGGHRGSTESSKCSASWLRSARFPACCGPYPTRRLRPGRRFCATI
jgi:hypothetical protein